MSDPYIGQDVGGQFRILKRIGSGGMGAVYKAEQADMNRFVAIKILHKRFMSRPDLVSRFRREARAMSHLSHSNTASVFLYGQLDDGSCYFVMEYLEGRNLAQLVKQEGPMDPARAAKIMRQVCAALDEAHHAGIIHRDLKPENIFITNQGGVDDFPKVLDFGLAKVTEKQMRPGSLILTREGMVFGTPEFMSPEQARGQTLDARTDIYSLGTIIYELLTGKLPFDARQSIEFIQLHVKATPIPLSERVPGLRFPPALDAAVKKALAKDPNDRFTKASELGEAIQSAIQTQSLPPSPTPMSSAPPALSSMPPSGQHPSGQHLTPHLQGPTSGQDGDSSSLPWVILGISAVFALLGLAAFLAAFFLL